MLMFQIIKLYTRLRLEIVKLNFLDSKLENLIFSIVQ